MSSSKLPPDESDSTLKSGQFNTAEKQKIRRLARESYGIKEIADKMKRTKLTIRKFLDENNIPHTDMPLKERDRTILKGKLKKKHYYPQLIQQFNNEELKYFCNLWADITLQFKDDVLPTEELDLKQYITQEILIGRALTEERENREQVDELKLEVSKEKGSGTPNYDKVAMCEAQIAAMKSASDASTQKRDKDQKIRDNLGKHLKETRESRIKRIEDSKTSFSNFLRMLEDEKLRENEGREAEILKLAKEKEKERLSDYHTYIDGSVDQPFLNHETVKEDNK